MLSESFIAASSAPPKLTSSQSQQLKDAGIFCHSLQPQQRLDHVYKKSVTEQNRVACSRTHVFAAQSGKATVHVYNREKGNQEATVPFAERPCSLILALDDTVLVLGTEGGGLYLWETTTGRQISTAQAHLQPVTALAVDVGGNWILSGSEDSNIHVWSLFDLLTLPATPSVTQAEAKTPRHTLTGHRGPIKSIITGGSTTSLDIAVSASTDNSAIVWNYQQAIRLRTILLPSTPLCLTLDPGDRALYAGLSDGSIQIIDFFPSSSSNTGSSASTFSIHTPSTSPLQPSPTDLLTYSKSSMSASATTSSIGATLSVNLSYDTNTLLSGHASGKILSWNIGRRAFSSTIADYPGAAITNLQFLPTTGLTTKRPTKLKQHSIMKPRPTEPFSGPRGGLLVGNYGMNVQFPSSLQAEDETEGKANMGPSDFDAVLQAPNFPDDLLADSILDLQNQKPAAGVRQADTLDGSTDFVSLEEPVNVRSIGVEGMAALKEQVEHLREMQRVSNRHVDQLMREKRELKEREVEAQGMRKRRQLEREQEMVSNWGSRV